MKSRIAANHMIDGIFALLLFLIFTASVLLVLTSGTRVYRDTVDKSAANFSERSLVAYLTAKVHHHDNQGAIELAQFGDGTALLLNEDFEGVEYATYIYIYDGYVRELYMEKALGLGAESGEPVMAAQSLELRAEPERSLLHISCTGDSGRELQSVVYVRSGIGGGD
ncbi:MAG: DUF4860 domain-containing protein [Bacillota bacterium]|nr:DUF4860 domain-containing protein [Bacillota bacterium]